MHALIFVITQPARSTAGENNNNKYQILTSGYMKTIANIITLKYCVKAIVIIKKCQKTVKATIQMYTDTPQTRNNATLSARITITNK